MLRAFSKVKEGRHYLTNCGDVVGPAIFKLSTASPGRDWTLNGCAYYGNGTAFGRSDGWALELIEEVPEHLLKSLISRNEHDRQIACLERKVRKLECAMEAFAGLPDAIDALRALKDG